MEGIHKGNLEVLSEIILTQKHQVVAVFNHGEYSRFVLGTAVPVEPSNIVINVNLEKDVIIKSLKSIGLET